MRIYSLVKTFLILLFAAIFVWMIILTTWTSLQMPIWDAFATFGDHPWAVATLWDAYFGFLTFYIWLAWKEKSFALKALWFILVMTLGNIAMSLYILIQLFRLPKESSLELLLSSRNG
jgi:hypothetical protein